MEARNAISRSQHLQSTDLQHLGSASGIEAKNTHNRLDTIAEYMTGYDAVVEEEVFDPD